MENNNFNNSDNSDELMYSLPDYITGELKDKSTISQIESRMKSDTSFRNEYDSLTSTLNFMKETELEKPSEIYFANLQANILSAVHKDTERDSESFSENILAKLLGYWKVLVPAVTVCLVIVIYSNMDTNNLPVTQENKPVVVTNENQKVTTPETVPQQKTAAGDTSIQTDNTQSDGTANVTPKQNNENLAMQQDVVLSDEAADDTEGSLFFGANDELQTQDEYEDLTPEEQSEILNNLKNTL